jgi:hypothetical protein
MKLTIGGQVISLPEGAQIDLEKSSPILNDDTGSFSYPFPVPTKPNEQRLGWPGRLQRVGDIPDKSFILEEQGMQVLRGEVEYDDVTDDEIPVVLKSGMTDFFSKMDGVKLSKIDMGKETLWPETTTWENVQSKIAQWSNYNDVDNSPLITAPCKMIENFDIDWNDSKNIIANSVKSARINVHNTDSTLKLLFAILYSYVLGFGYFMLQAKVWWVLEKIFMQCGYTVLLNELKTNAFTNKLELFTRPFYVSGSANNPAGTPTGACKMVFYGELEYAKIMPDVLAIDFVNAIMDLLCVRIDIDERTLEVSILFRKKIFEAGNVDQMRIKELTGRIHSEQKSKKGFTLSFADQDDELDTRSDYEITATVATTLPSPTNENDIYHVTSTDRDFICLKDDADVLYWRRLGRLKRFVDGDGEEPTEIKVKVPKQEEYFSAEVPKIEIQPLSDLSDGYFVPLSEIIISVYRGRQNFNGYNVPFICADKYSIGETYPLKSFTTALTPAYLNEQFYNDWLKWRAYRARFFTKYIQLTLPQLLALKWGKRYVVSGVEFILTKINYTLPHRGVVKVEGWTV